MHNKLKAIANRISDDLQKYEELWKLVDECKTEDLIRFPQGALRKADAFRRRFKFIQNDTLLRNVSYSLILSDIYHWLMNRINFIGTAREMIIKEQVCLMGALAESLTKDYLGGISSPKLSYKKRTEKLLSLGIIDEGEKEDLDWLWDCRNYEHLYLVKHWEYQHYKAEHYNRALETVRKLEKALNADFKKRSR